MQKLYCYVDETGQDTKGQFFLVVVLMISRVTVTQLEAQLTKAEQESGKWALKWNATSFTRRQRYLHQLPTLLKDPTISIFFSSFYHTTEYTTCIAQVLIQAIQKKAIPPYEVNVFIDGLNDAERERVRRFLRSAKIKYRALRGIRDESSPFIRLCDALAGLLRDAEEKKSYAQTLIAQFEQQHLIARL